MAVRKKGVFPGKDHQNCAINIKSNKKHYKISKNPFNSHHQTKIKPSILFLEIQAFKRTQHEFLYKIYYIPTSNLLRNIWDKL